MPFEELLWLPHHWRRVAHLPTAQFTARGAPLTLEKKKQQNTDKFSYSVLAFIISKLHQMRPLAGEVSIG